MRRRAIPVRWAAAVAGVLGLLAMISACSSGPSYYPLDARYSWTYRITFESDDPEQQSRSRPLEAAVRNLPPADYQGTTTTSQVSSVGTSHSTRIIAESGAGVQILAQQGIKDTEPKAVASPQYILRYPMRVGTEWVDEGEPRFAPGDAMVQGVSRIDGFEAVTVPAGSYADAAKVVFEGSDSYGAGDITIHATSWFAPRVGLVRYEQIDKFIGYPPFSGRFVIELIGFREL